jgi:hypothetical protein
MKDKNAPEFKTGSEVDDPVDYKEIDLGDPPEQWNKSVYRDRVVWATEHRAYTVHLTSPSKVEFREAPSLISEEAEERMQQKEYDDVNEALDDIHEWLEKHNPTYEDEVTELSGVGGVTAEYLSVEYDLETRQEASELPEEAKDRFLRDKSEI